MLDPAAPQLVVNARVLQFSWLPADPDAVAALLPTGLRARPDRQVFLCQYVVDDESQTTGFGAYSLTYLGISLDDVDPADGDGPGGWWSHYLASSPRVREYAAGRGVPAVAGETTVDVRGEQLTAETHADGRPIIRTVARVGHTSHVVHGGHHRYLTGRDGELTSADYPYVAEPVTPFEVESVEFLAPEHPVYPLRPANPLIICSGFYSPRVSFAYPAGPHALDEPPAAEPAHQVPARRARSGLPSGS
ncbi:acetoacetate decarboxylase family protein [Micromonospora sp. RTP1Z1]|uniref:acetoacetate decarboxylase family protein n=1 Tax=Micromonospora sp. RTP1Z1 TaxID=2994043 RepID=UPI0029C89D08|nr:acetoacetate decarboxylase family protein [Micromonospora sp. RTP1Z1]